MGQPAARIGDSVVEGVIVSGEPTVLIGGTPDGVACKACALAAAKGSPVNTMYGFKFLDEAADFALPAPTSFGWSRYYSSAIGWVGLLGAGWRTALDLCIDAEAHATRLRDLQGRTLTFGPLLPGQQRFSVSEGVWILRGGPDLALDRPDRAANQALDPAWNSLPEPWRSHPDCLCTTTGDGYYLIFAATPLLAASALREADGPLPVLPASAVNESAEQTSAIFEGRYQLVALHSSDGYVTRFDWAQYPQGWFPRWIEDSAQRLYQLHYLQLAHHEALARDPFASPAQDKTLLRLAGIRLDHDPQREGQTLSERFGTGAGIGSSPRASQLHALDTLIERSGRGSFTAQRPDTNPWLVRYQYSGEGDLIAVLDQTGEALRQFDYRNHLLVRHQYLGGEDVRYTYDRLPQHPADLREAEHCRVIRQERADGLSYDFHYQDLDQYGPRSTCIRDSLGREERLFFEGDAGLRRVVKTEFADGRSVTQQFDPSGHPISSTDPLGRTTWFNYDAKGRLIATTDAAGRTQKVELDAKGHPVGTQEAGVRS